MVFNSTRARPFFPTHFLPLSIPQPLSLLRQHILFSTNHSESTSSSIIMLIPPKTLRRALAIPFFALLVITATNAAGCLFLVCPVIAFIHFGNQPQTTRGMLQRCGLSPFQSAFCELAFSFFWVVTAVAGVIVFRYSVFRAIVSRYL